MEMIKEFLKPYFSSLFGDDKMSWLDDLDANPDKAKSSKDDKKIGDKITVQLLSLLEMFQFATIPEIALLVLGTIFAFLHGASFPVLGLLFGNFCEAFISQMRLSSNLTITLDKSPKRSLPTSGNESSDSEFNIESMFGSFGDSIGVKTSSKPMTHEEFLAYGVSLSIYFALIGFVALISSFIQTACWECAAVNQTLKIRQLYVAQVLRQELSWHESRPSGYLVAKLADDIERIKEGIGHRFSLIIENVSCFAVGAFFALCTNWKLTLLFGTAVPFIIGKILILLNLLVTKCIEQQEQYGRIAAVVAETLAAPKTVCAFGQELEEIDIYGDPGKNGFHEAKRRYTISGIGTGLLYALILASYSLAFWYAMNQLILGAISTSQIYTVFFCVSIGVLALMNILPFIPDIANAYGCSKVVFGIISNVPTIDPYNQDGLRPKRTSGQIKFSQVTFSYPSCPDLAVIRDLTLLIKPGETVGFIGDSAAGKSTLAQLLPRFYDPQSGFITIGGVDIKHLNLTWLRNRVAFVSQNLIFDKASVFENLRGSQKDLTIEEVVKVAKVTTAHNFIQKLPKGYNTVIGTNVKQFSHGESQLLALTQALMKNPKILVLDECFSGQRGLISSSDILECLKLFRPKGTTIVISHSVELGPDLDKIFVFKRGQLVGEGTHDELIQAKNEVYYRMAEAEKMLNRVKLPKRDNYNFCTDEPTVFTDVRVGPLMELKNELKEMEEGEDFKHTIFWDLYDTLKDTQNSKCMVQGGLWGCLICGLTLPAFAYIFSQLFIILSEDKDVLDQDSKIWIKIGIFVGVSAAIGHALRYTFVSILGEALTAEIRRVCYLFIFRQEIPFFDDPYNSPERLYVRLINDAPFFKIAVGSGLASAISAVFSIIFASIYLLIVSWQLFIIILISTPLYVAAFFKEVYFLRNLLGGILQNLEISLLFANRALQNVEMIHSQCLQINTTKRYSNMVNPIRRPAHRQAIHFACCLAFTEALTFFVLASVFRLGIFLIEHGSLEASELFKIFIVLSFSSTAIGHLMAFIPCYVKARRAFRKLYTIIEFESKIDPFDESGEDPPDLAPICFDRVSFNYTGQVSDPMVLNNFSFTLGKGKSLALFGKNGKSTILFLMERFYDILGGTLTLGGVDIKELNLGTFRYSIGLIFQEPDLFNRSIRDNIAYGWFDMDELSQKEIDEKFEAVVQDVGLEKLLSHLPNGLDTVVGEKGCRLTIGDRHRIAFARAIIREPSILLVDEPTSSLGAVDKQAILKTLEKIVKGRTCIIVSSKSAGFLTFTDELAMLSPTGNFIPVNRSVGEDGEVHISFSNPRT